MMKKTGLYRGGMLALALVCILTVAGCDDEDSLDVGDLKGTWEHTPSVDEVNNTLKPQMPGLTNWGGLRAFTINSDGTFTAKLTVGTNPADPTTITDDLIKNTPVDGSMEPTEQEGIYKMLNMSGMGSMMNGKLERLTLSTDKKTLTVEGANGDGDKGLAGSDGQIALFFGGTFTRKE